MHHNTIYGAAPSSMRRPRKSEPHIRRRYANKETIAEAEQRIQMISLDIAEHFKTKVRPNGFKAQVVGSPAHAGIDPSSRF